MNAHWSSVALADIFEIARGGSPRPIERFITDSPDGLNWVKIGDATEGDGKFISRTREKIRPEGLSKTRRVHAGDFLLTNSMSFGRPYIMATDRCIHDGWLLLRPRNEELVDRGYFYHLLSSDFMFAQFSARAAGSTVKNLNTEIVSSVQVKLPPLDEQRQIAAILDKADALRQKRKRAIALLDTLTQSIFLDVFGDTIANPANCPTTPLGALVDPRRGITYGIVQRGPDQEQGVDVVRISDFVSGQLSRDGLKRTTFEISSKYRRTILNGGEIVISIRGTVGRCAVVPPGLVGANVSREVAVIPTIDESQNEFYLALLRSGPVQRRITQDVKGVAQSGINLEDLRELPVIQPPSNLLKQFIDRRNQFNQFATATRGSEVELDKMFTSLQHRAFSGQL